MKKTRKGILVGIASLLLITFITAFLLYICTAVRFNTILDKIQSNVHEAADTLVIQDPMGKIKELGYNLINANTLTFLFSLLGIVVIWIAAVIFQSIETKLKKYDRIKENLLINSRFDEIVGGIQYNLLNLKVCLITEQHTILPDCLREISDAVSGLKKNRYGISESLLRRINGTLEELRGMVEKNLRTPARLDHIDSMHEYRRCIERVCDAIGKEKDQQWLVECYEERLRELK